MPSTRHTRAALLSLVIAGGLAGCPTCRREAPPPPPDAGLPVEPVDAGPPDEPDAGPGLRLSGTTSGLEVLAGCQACEEEEGGPAHCDVCRRGWRCVRSLRDPTWAVIEEVSGFTLYRQQSADAGALTTWQRVGKVKHLEGTPERGPRLAQVPAGLPVDLERHLTPTEGECPPVGETPQDAIEAYFAEEEGELGLDIGAVHASGEDPAWVLVRVWTEDGIRGLVVLQHDAEICLGWRVEAFGMPGCPSTLPGFIPADLIP